MRDTETKRERDKERPQHRQRYCMYMDTDSYRRIDRQTDRTDKGKEKLRLSNVEEFERLVAIIQKENTRTNTRNSFKSYSYCFLLRAAVING